MLSVSQPGGEQQAQPQQVYYQTILEQPGILYQQHQHQQASDGSYQGPVVEQVPFQQAVVEAQPSVLYQPQQPSVEQQQQQQPPILYQQPPPPSASQPAQIVEAPHPAQGGVLYQQPVVEQSQVIYQPHQPPVEPHFQEQIIPHQPEAVVVSGGQYVQEAVDPLARKILEPVLPVLPPQPVDQTALSPSAVPAVSQPEVELQSQSSREKVSSGVSGALPVFPGSQFSVSVPPSPGPGPGPAQLPFIRLDSCSRSSPAGPRRGSLPVAQHGSLLPVPLPPTKAQSAESSPGRVAPPCLTTYSSIAHKLPFPSQSLRRRSADPSELLCYRTSSSSPEELMVPLLDQRRASGGSSLMLSPVWEQSNMMTIREVISLCGSTTSLASTQVGH